MKLTVKKAPTVDREKLIVRINSNDRPIDINWYDYVQIKSETGKLIVCKLHGDDIPEIPPGQGRSLIYINEPLRGKLGVKKDGDTLDFEIKKVTSWLAWYYFIRYHPDDVVKISTWLAVIAVLITVVLGSISIVVALRS